MHKISPTKILAILFFLSLLFRLGGYGQSGLKELDFRSPLDIELLLSGNFGEVRSNHFHSGLDFKTQGQSGHNVMAIEEAYVSRIKVEPGGYGKAIYLRHPNGYTSVYGHLKEFSPEIAAYVLKQQYRLKSFRVDLYLNKETFKVKKGDRIALSGNSGSSQGPHLHFELRDSQTENPVNPLLFTFNIRDNRPPTIKSIKLYQLTEGRGITSASKHKVSGQNGKYRLAGKQVITIGKSFGVGIETIDFLNGSSNKCGVYSIKMFVDKELYFNSRTDEFSFAESRYINSFIDYGEFIEKGSSLYKTFIDPNNQLSVFEFAKNRGVIDLQDEEIHDLSFEIEDVAGNISTLSFKVRADTAGEIQAGDMPLYDAYFHYAEQNHFEEENLDLKIPPKALYSNLYFKYDTEPAPAGSYSRMHKIHNEKIPVHKNFTLAIKPDSLPDELKPFALICRFNDKNRMSPVGGKWVDGYLVASSRSFGNFGVTVDTIPPTIKARNFSKGVKLANKKELRFTISDDFSGIASFKGEIDGEWVLFEWDPKNRLLKHKLRHNTLEAGKAHNLYLELIDGKGNKQEFTMEIN